MKYIYNKAWLMLIALMPLYSAQAQSLYANREWAESSPVTGNSYYHTSTIIVSGNLVVTGNILNGNGDTDIYTYRLDFNGDTLWSASFSGDFTGGGDDYGIELLTTSGGDIVVTGAVKTNAGGYDYAVLWYDGSTGSLDWSYIWDGNGGTDIPSVIRSSSNEIYVGGGSEATNGFSDFGLIRVSSAGNLVWESFFDHSDLHDGISGLSFISSYVMAVGATAVNVGDWDMTAVLFNKSTGAQYSTNTVDIAGATIIEANAIVMDSMNNIYITGYAEVSGDKTIQTIALDSALALKWIANQSATGLDNVGYDIGIDSDENVYVAGYSEYSAGKPRGILIKYSDTGDTLFSKLYGNIVTEDGVKFRKIAVEPNGDVYVTGTSYDGGLNSFAFVKYNEHGDLKLMKKYQADSLDDDGFEIGVDGNDVYITGFTETISGRRMTSIKYSLIEKDSSKTYNSTGKPVYAGRDLIVRVDTSLIKQDQINDLEIEFWTLSEIFDTGFVEDLERQLEVSCGDEHCPVKVFRIFTDLKTTDTTTISRRGDTIKIPTFWATFLFEFPNGVNITDASDAISSLFPDIKYSTYNLIGELNSVPNDPEYAEGQICMHTDATPQWEDVHINIEPAWDLETGKRYIKTGVFDGPVEWDHEDYGGMMTSKVDGYSFEAGNEGPIQFIGPSGYSTFHGTASMGQIGAIRNNDIGIAGIAGGSYANSNSLDSSGTALYSLNVLSYNTNLVYMHHLSNAVIGTTIDSDTGAFTYGLHVTNHSYGVSQAPDPSTGQPYANFLDTNITLLREAFHFSNRNQVIVVASRGNSGVMQDTGGVHDNYPGVLDDDWIICVGGLGTDGNYHDGDIGSAFEYGYKTSRGPEIDVSSFSCGARNMTTIDSSDYAYYSGTSASTPQVAGVAALMLSYINHEDNHYDNLAPEDVEYILQMTAVDRDTLTHPGYDTLTGYGIINAGAALHQIRKDRYTVAHFGTDLFPHFTDHVLYSSGDTVTLSERYENEAGVWFLPNVPYIVDAYKITTQSGHQIFSDEVVIAQWPRPSSSNIFAYFDTTANVLMPRERVSLDSIDNIWGYLHGFVYKVKDTLGNTLGWWPFDTTNTQSFDLTYTLLKYDTLYYLNNPEVYKPFEVKVYPNPTQDGQVLVLNVDQPIDASIRLVDINGRLIKTVYNGHFEEGQVSFNIDLSELSPGMYLYAILPADGKPRYIKVMKQ